MPTTRAELEELGWDACDVVLVTGDAYVDHPSFGAAVIGRVLEAQGLRVGILDQPDFRSVDAFRALGRPRLMWGVTAGNMDSMVNHYTSEARIRTDDAYTPGGRAGARPDRAVIVYAQRCREAFPGVPVVLGGVEASLRRLAHYDYWSDKVRRSVVLDAKADLVLYGNAERAVVELAQRLAAGEPIASIHDLRGSVFVVRDPPPGDWVEIDATEPFGRPPGSGLVAARTRPSRNCAGDRPLVRLPAFERVRDDKLTYAHASHVFHRESHPGSARPLVQRHGDRDLWVLPPPLPLSSTELDAVFELPFRRRPHPRHAAAMIPAYEMIKTSVTITRGCFGGCTFCSIAEHEGRIVQSRSEASILREIEVVRDQVPGFAGVISDLGGPTANMWQLGCTDEGAEARCRRRSCIHPRICPRLETDHGALVRLYRRARAVRGVRRVLVASGLRFDLAARSPDYVEELARHHVGGHLKIAPEHVSKGPLSKMMKPGIDAYERFKGLFDRASAAAGKKQYLVPYFIAAHPGTTDQDMLELALWLKRSGLRVDQVQTFLPSPMTMATAMYHTGLDPLRRISSAGPTVFVPRGLGKRRLHKALLRWHDPSNWSLLRRALRAMERADLIGPAEHQLVPARQPPKATSRRKKPVRGPRRRG